MRKNRDELGRFIEGHLQNEKITPDDALEVINKVYQYNIDNPDNYHLGYSLAMQGKYAQWWTHIYGKFQDNSAIVESMKNVETILEGRIVNRTMSGEAKSAAMAIFVLKNNYGYRDKSEVDQNVSFEAIDKVSYTDGEGADI